MIFSERLDEIYRGYGFRKGKAASPDVRVYTFRSGHFNNAEIVVSSDCVDYRKDFSNYTEAGYACHVKEYNNIDEVEEVLFQGFFSVKFTRERFFEEYSRFYKKQTDALGVSYRYVNPPYRNASGAAEHHKVKPVVDEILLDLKKEGSGLIILEAAAGYGKTCTSFEVLNRCLSEFENKIPFFVELSRNRQAKIFRYVLLDEANRVFPGLNAELVERQIRDGRLILILDGFDELLYRAESLSSDFDEVEPMLETISDLLQGQAKIVLTTRRTAIFSGDRFHQWMENHVHDFEVARRSLLRPEIVDWLSGDQLSIIRKRNFPISSLSNPVLLAYLAGQEESEFDSLMEAPGKVVDRYFSSLLEREQERQDLIMEPEEQYEIFKNMAKRMVGEDFTSEDNEYLKIRIYEDNLALLHKVRRRYPSERKPSLEDLSAKLVTHALMDRRSEEDDKVSFINDFVLGNFVGESAIESEDKEWVAAENFIDKSIISFSSRDSDKKISLLSKLDFVLQILPVEQRVFAEVSLSGGVRSDLSGCTLSGVSISSTHLGHDTQIKDCVFFGCTFNNVVFSMKNLSNVGFVGCSFYNSFFNFDDDSCGESYVYHLGCEGEFERLKVYSGGGLDGEEIEGRDDHEVMVLEQFWPKGRSHFSHKRMTKTLFRGAANRDRGSIVNAIDRLQRRNLIRVCGDTAEINSDKVGEIMSLLGRG